MLISLVLTAFGSPQSSPPVDSLVGGPPPHERLLTLGPPLEPRVLQRRAVLFRTKLLTSDSLPVTSEAGPSHASQLQELLASESSCSAPVDEATTESLRTLLVDDSWLTIAVSNGRRPAFWTFNEDGYLQRQECKSR